MDLLLPNPVNRHHPLARGLAAWYLSVPGLTGGQYWYDLCGLYHGTLTNGAAWNRLARPGALAGCMNFDGVNDQIAIPDIVRTSDYAVSCWLNQTSPLTPTRNYGTILAQNSSRGFFLRNQSANDYKLALNDPTETLSATLLSTGTWYHILLSVTGGTATYYINGQADANHPSVSGSTTWKLMGYEGVAADSLFGYLDDIRIYNNRFFTAAEAFDLYQNSRLGCPGLLRRAGRRFFSQATSAGIIYTFTVQAMDANGVLGTQVYAWTVNGLTKYLFSIRATDAGGNLGQQAYEMLLRTP